MKRKSTSQSAFFNRRVLIGLVVLASVFLALFAVRAGEQTRRGETNPTTGGGGPLTFGFQVLQLNNNDDNTVVGDQTLSNNTAAEGNTAIPSGPNWTITGSLNTARYFHTATLPPNRMVLVAGGQTPPDGFASTSAELYDPASGHLANRKWFFRSSQSNRQYESHLSGSTRRSAPSRSLIFLREHRLDATFLKNFSPQRCGRISRTVIALCSRFAVSHG
jgi:hypothetical protein